MYQYEIDPASIAEDREWAPIRPQTDGQADEVKPVYPFQLRCAWDIIIPWTFWIQTKSKSEYKLRNVLASTTLYEGMCLMLL